MSAGFQDEPDLIGAAGFIFQGPVRAKRSRPAEPADSAVKKVRRRMIFFWHYALNCF